MQWKQLLDGSVVDELIGVKPHTYKDTSCQKRHHPHKASHRTPTPLTLQNLRSNLSMLR